MGKVKSVIEVPFNDAQVGGTLFDFVYNWILKRYNREYRKSDDMVILYGEDVNVQPTWAELLTIHAEGGNWFGVQAGIELPGTAANNDVPVEVRGATYEDENEVTQNRTWLEWLKTNGTITVYKHVTENRYIFQAVRQGDLQSYRSIDPKVFASDILSHDEIYPIHIGDADVIEWTDYQSRLSDGNWEPFEIP